MADSSTIWASLNRLASDLSMWWDPITYFSAVIGFALVAWGLYKLAHSASGTYGRSTHGGVMSAMVPALVGSALLALPTVMNIATYTAFRSDAPLNAMAYIPQTGGEAQGAFTFIFVVIHLIGIYAVIRGLYILATLPEGRGGEWGSAIWYLIGGAFALRIDLAAKAVGASTGGLLHSVVDRIFT